MKKKRENFTIYIYCHLHFVGDIGNTIEALREQKGKREKRIERMMASDNSGSNGDLDYILIRNK